MFTDAREDRLTRRIAALYGEDAQFADARPSEAVSAAIDTPSLRLPDVVQTVMEGYADRPALGQRAVELVTDPQTGRTTAELLPRFDTVSYAELWESSCAVATALAADGVRPGDRVCILGFASVDYTIVDLSLMRIGAVSVPLQTNAPITQLQSIVTETEPTVIATSVDYLADAVELSLSGHAPARLVVFKYCPQVDDQREALQAAQNRLTAAGSTVVVETLADVLARGDSLPTVPAFISDEDDPPALLLYTSGSTGAPKGAIHSARRVANGWRGSVRGTFGQHTADPSIVLGFMPMSHVLGRGIILYGALGNGGTVYFAGKSDLSTLLEDLALVRPTQLHFPPRIWDTLFEEFQSQVHRRAGVQPDRSLEAIQTQVMAELRRNLLGGRVVAAVTASAPISPQLRTWAEALLDLHLVDAYGSTEAGHVLVDGVLQRPSMIDYKLVDVPELGYFHTDQPHPRGELLVKSVDMFSGYYKRSQVTAEVFDSDGYYRTGDIMAEVGPDQLVYLDRRNSVLKLSQGEFVAVSSLEAVFSTASLVSQIYLYGNSTRAYLVAVVVPTEDAVARYDAEELKALISNSLQSVAETSGLASYEVPRDFFVETTPFTLENGLLTGVRKLARPRLEQRYGPPLEQLYTELAEKQDTELRALRRSGAKRPVLDTVGRAAAALLGAATADLAPDAHFADLGGDSLSALTFANLLREIFDIDVPVGVIVSPATDLAAIASYIETECSGATTRATFTGVHGRDATEAHARDLTLDKFVDAATLAGAPTLPGPSSEIRTVLLTGATGFLGRYLVLEWLERMHLVDGKLICLVRGRDDAAARARLDKTFDRGDPELLRHYRELAADHLEVIAGDKAEPDLGLDPQTWQRLADKIDMIVDPAALVNHVLPYRELFGPNVLGTAELIRIALTTRLKQFVCLSTIAVGAQIAPGSFTEDADIRVISPTRRIDDSYANGYSTSKWAGEVLLREAHDLCGLPVSVFRCDMILAEPRYAGQLNLSDRFTRLMFSLIVTGIAPGSFYELDASGNRQRAHYDGLPVDFIAEAISTLGEQARRGFQTYHVMNPYDDGIGLDEFVDWLVDAGYRIQRVPEYGDWLQRFDTALRALPGQLRQASLLPLLHNYQRPDKPIRGSIAPVDGFRAAVQEAKIGPDKDIPHITAAMIVNYITDLQLLGLL